MPVTIDPSRSNASYNGPDLGLILRYPEPPGIGAGVVVSVDSEPLAS